MSLGYKKIWCENCQRFCSGEATKFQKFLLIPLLCLYIIPGVIYYFKAEPSVCRFCGLKKADRNDKLNLEETLKRRKENKLESTIL